nr:MAG: replication associated protein [Cressdnaviricota sp.]
MEDNIADLPDNIIVEPLVPVVPGRGRVGNSRINPARKWFLTLNNYTEADIVVLQNLKVKEYVFQCEIGESGTPHIQGYFYFAQKVRPSSLSKGHWELCRNPKAAADYCAKLETSTGRRWIFPKRLPRYEPDRIVLRPWQETIHQLLLSKPNDRSVFWIYDINGGAGKTAFCRWMIEEYPNQILYVSGKGSDIKYAVAEWIKEKHLGIVLFNLPRSAEGHISYDAIECIKDSVLFSNKYESCSVALKPCHVIIFANVEPDYTKLSLDRWVVWEVQEGELIPKVASSAP